MAKYYAANVLRFRYWQWGNCLQYVKYTSSGTMKVTGTLAYLESLGCMTLDQGSVVQLQYIDIIVAGIVSNDRFRAFIFMITASTRSFIAFTHPDRTRSV